MLEINNGIESTPTNSTPRSPYHQNNHLQQIGKLIASKVTIGRLPTRRNQKSLPKCRHIPLIRSLNDRTRFQWVPIPTLSAFLPRSMLQSRTYRRCFYLLSDFLPRFALLYKRLLLRPILLVYCKLYTEQCLVFRTILNVSEKWFKIFSIRFSFFCLIFHFIKNNILDNWIDGFS